MNDIESQVSTIENPLTVDVDVKEHRPFEQGMRSTVTQLSTADKRKGYFIYQKTCVRCGERQTHDNDLKQVTKKDRCDGCGGLRFDHIYPVVNPDQTSKIINTKTQYECANCHKKYDVPTPCCIENYAINRSVNNVRRGWYCTNCHRIYTEKIICCTDGKLVSGSFMLQTPQLSGLVGV